MSYDGDQLHPEDSGPQNHMKKDYHPEADMDLKMKDELWDSRRRMSWLALIGIIGPTLYIILRISDVEVLEQLADLMSWYYLALASIVGAYFGFQAWASIRGRGK
jgi:hypothetical protein